MIDFFFRNSSEARVVCAYHNLLSEGPTYVVVDGPGDDDSGDPNFAVLELEDAIAAMLCYQIVYGDGSESEIRTPF